MLQLIERAREHATYTILYTSRTTSQPKGVVTTHDNIESQIQALTSAWQGAFE